MRWLASLLFHEHTSEARQVQEMVFIRERDANRNRYLSVVTANVMSDDRAQGLETGRDDVAWKPINRTERIQQILKPRG